MKRIASWFLSTVTVVVLMFGYHTSTSSTLSVASQPAYVGSAGTDGSTSTTRSNGGSTGNSTGNGSTTVTGDTAQTRWGPVQVELTVKAGSVTEVRVLQYPTGNSTD